jgi:hypothetical protein
MQEMEKGNCTLESVKLLPHDIGYLKLNGFPDASVCGTTVAGCDGFFEPCRCDHL